MANVKIFSKKNLDIFVDNLIQDKKYEVVAVKSKGKRFVFDTIDSSEELRLDYDITILPPKKYFLPQYENLFNYNLKEKFDVKPDTEKKPLICLIPNLVFTSSSGTSTYPQ